MIDETERLGRAFGTQGREAIGENAWLARERAQKLVTECVQLIVDVEWTLLGVDERTAAVSCARDAARQSVRQFGEAVRASGAPPERAVAMVKAMAGDAIRDVTSTRPISYQTAVRDLHDGVVRWMIDGYYELSSADGLVQ